MSPQVAADIVRLVDEFSPPTVDETEILRSKLQSQGRIITHINEKNARLARALWTANHAAQGLPTPRVVRQIKEIRAAAGTNSAPKIVALVEAGRRSAADQAVLDAAGRVADWMAYLLETDCECRDCAMRRTFVTAVRARREQP